MSQFPPSQQPPSSYPPPPPGGGYGPPPPQGSYPPPGGYAPPGYATPGGYPPGAYSMPPQGNGWGLASLITGFVGFCVPFFGGLLAMLFGAIGVVKSRKTHSGAALSVVGLILGLLSVGMYALFGGAIWAAVQGTKVNREIAKQFINDLQAGNITAAQAATDGTLTSTELQAASTQLKNLGTITDITTFGVNAGGSASGGGQVVCAGAITASSGTQLQFQTVQVKAPDGTWKIQQFNLGLAGGVRPVRPGSATPPPGAGSGGPGTGGDTSGDSKYTTPGDDK